MRRPLFPSARITRGSLIGVFIGWVLASSLLKFFELTPVAISYSFVWVTGIVGSAVILLIALVDSKLRNRPKQRRTEPH